MSKRQTVFGISCSDPTCPDRATHFWRVALKKPRLNVRNAVLTHLGHIGQIEKTLFL